MNINAQRRINRQVVEEFSPGLAAFIDELRELGIDARLASLQFHGAAKERYAQLVAAETTLNTEKEVA